MFLHRSLWARIFTKINLNFETPPKRNNSWLDAGSTSSWETHCEMFNSKRRDSESSPDGEERRMPRATSAPLDHGSTWSIRGRHLYIHLPCPSRSGLAVGWFYIEIEGPSSRELVFDQRVDKFQRENTNCAARSRVNKKHKRTIYTILPVFPIAAVQEYLSAECFFEIAWKQNFATSCFH